jgi:peptidoglycan/xylan/chitin deacetylase (PgdA/CDA1 family)
MLVVMLTSARSKQIRRTALMAALTLSALFGVNRFASARTVQLLGALVSRVETRERVLALTFDDGPRRGPVQTLLPLLAASQAHATFFVEGRELAQDLALGRELLAAGHKLGNHSYSHARMVLKSQNFIADEIERTDRAIRAAGQVGAILFRPPYGKKLLGLPWYLSKHDRPTIMWDVAPDDSASRTASQIAADVLAQVRPGSIILLHVMQASRRASLAAVPAILAGLSTAGYRFVTVSTLLRE